LARKILLADDSVTAQNMGRKILSDAGYEVIAVNNGSAALKKIAELKPDLVILDVYMPGYSGLEVCQRLKESQDTARIPVLLSVGKLEPFKPDEAQRVHADAFIVKPFEASELLSALSKLEDKVVPRSEPSKPGRFARAMAVAEESSRGGENQASSAENNGWKNRINFPHEKAAGPEEKVADEASFYNPMNRDLRTVVETPAEKAEREAAPPVAMNAEVQNPPAPVIATVPFEDPTPQEAAAIATAVAHMKSGDAPLETYTGQVAAEASPIAATKSESKESEKEKDAELPATIAAGAEPEIEIIKSDSRWSAVPMALDNLEASNSLEQEMREAYAVYSAYENEPVQAPSAPEPTSAPSEPSYPSVSASEPAVAEAPVAVMATPEPEPASPQASPTLIAEAASAESPATQLTETPIVTNNPAQDAVPEPVQAESAPAVSSTEITSGVLAEPNPSFVPAAQLAEAAPAAVEQPISQTVVPAPVMEEMPCVPPLATEVVPVIEAATSHPEAEAPAPSEAERRAEPRMYSQPESDVVKDTAAAWASWRQVRDTGNTITGAEDNSQQIDTPQPPDSAAMAVAAGAEQIAQPVSTPVTSDSPADVASIVDSVLADLRPRLMEEISRKMAQKK
jgi:CheY-like chemotaxis protein